MQIEREVYLTKNEIDNIKENQDSFKEELRINICKKLNEIYHTKSDSLKSKYIYVLISSKYEPVIKKDKISGDKEIVNEVKLKYVIFNDEPWPFLNAMCVRIDTSTGKQSLIYALPPVGAYKAILKGSKKATPQTFEYCKQFKKFREEHGAIPFATHEQVNDMDWEKVEEIMHKEVRERLVSVIEEKKND